MNSSSIVDSLTLKGVSESGGIEVPAGIESSSAGLSVGSTGSTGSTDSPGSTDSVGSPVGEAGSIGSVGSAGRMGRMARGEKPGGEG